MDRPSGVSLKTHEGIAWVTLSNESRRNALTLKMYRQVAEIFAKLSRDPELRAVVLRGGGELAFSAGGEITEFGSVRRPGRPAEEYNAAVLNAERAIENCPAPVIAMIYGACVGGGCGLALAADIRMGDTTARMGITAGKLGLVYGLESVRKLMDSVGRGAASRLLFTAEILEADEAFRVGLIDVLCAPEDLEDRVTSTAHSMSQLSMTSVRGAKDFISRVARGERIESEATARIRDESFSGADYVEGVAAFSERRPANFS